MFILIAESKTMTPCDTPVSQNIYQSHRPMLEDDATLIMESLQGMQVSELAKYLKLSTPMITKLQRMIYEFPNKALGSEAINAFTGVVFKAFDYTALNCEGKSRTTDRVRIVSSLYGWLRPDDIVKPYRFDFTTRLAPGGMKFSAFWRDKVTECLLTELSAKGYTDIINLMPADAEKCINWKLIKPHVNVKKVEFQETLPGGNVRTPNAGRLKTLRGELLQQIIRENITSPEDLMKITGDNYFASGTTTPEGSIVFQTA
ncbi:MAG: YaaA family protein [Duncaniella sp.]|nr:YaaA family protein [Duncaniella sp.]